MMIGIGIGINRLRGGAFSEGILFDTGVGAWYDGSDLSTLFQDTAGITPVTTAGQSNALALDKSQGLVLGPELVTNGDFSAGTDWTEISGGSALTISGGQASFTISSGFRGIYQPKVIALGVWLKVSFDVISVSAGTVEILGKTAADGISGATTFSRTATAPGTHSAYVFTSGISASIAVRNNTSGSTTVVDNISVRELPGNHATQGTGSFQPKYQIAPPRLNVDGVDDRLATTLNPTTSGSIAVRMRSNTASKVAVGSQPASDGRCYIGLASDGSLAGGIGTQATSVIVDQQSDRRNRLTYTEDFGDAYWSRDNCAVTLNAVTAPDGTNTADLVYPLSTGSDRRVRRSFLTEIGAGNYTASAYLKSAGRDFAYMLVLQANSINDVVWFDLANGAVGTVGSSALSATIVDVGDGWYRCTVSGPYDGSGAFSVNVANADNSTVVTASGTNGIYVWGAQLEAGTSATAYQPVTGAALRDIRGTWTTGILTWNGSAVALYLDGEQVYSAAQSGAVNTTIPIMVGGLNSNGTGAAFHAGDIARAIVINRVLTAGEIASLTALWSTIE